MTEDLFCSPAEVRLRSDLTGDQFLAGVRAGRWRSAMLQWPILMVEVAVGDEQFALLRLEVDGYPARAPAGQLWDAEKEMALSLDQWPRGGSAEKVFRPDWSVSNANAPYLPCDRTGLATHPDWATAHPERSWNPSRSITFYLWEIARELWNAWLPRNGVAA